MEIVLAVVIGVIYGAGIYMILRRSLFKLILGMSLLGHASNLFIFVIGRVTRNAPPLIEENSNILLDPYSDPLPQALILTAIVIGFGVQAFAVVLIKRAHSITQVDDFDVLSTQDI